MNKTFALLAAAATFVVANTQLAPVAEAGGGIRLGFGFPLGSFVARPCASCGNSSSHSYRSHNNHAAERRAAARRAAIAEAKAERAAAARRAAIAEAKAERAAAARRAAIAEAQAEKAAARRAAALAEARRKARIAKQAEEKKEVEKAEVTDAPDKAPLPARAETQEGDVAVGEPKVILSNGKSAQEEKVAVAPVITVPTPEPKKVVETAAKPTDCKKFVPSAGLTITVPCQ